MDKINFCGIYMPLFLKINRNELRVAGNNGGETI